MSVQRTQSEITSTEFLDWIIYLDEKKFEESKLDHQLAAIQAEIRRSWVKDPRRVKEDNFIIKFVKKIKKKLTKEEATKRDKAIMGSALGIKE